MGARHCRASTGWWLGKRKNDSVRTPARPRSFGRLLRRVAPRPRLLPPQRVARLVCDHDDINTVEFTLDLAGFDRAAAHDAGAAGPSMGLGYAVDNGQAALGQAGANLPPLFLAVGRVSHRDRVTPASVS
jgi:hypothetical protein